jgi:hypothetical protein
LFFKEKLFLRKNKANVIFVEKKAQSRYVS